MRLPERSVEWTQVTQWEGGQVSSLQDSLAAEEPLEIRIRGAFSIVTMRTPGHDSELAAGFLLTDGIIESLEQIADLSIVSKQNGVNTNAVEVTLIHVPSDLLGSQRASFSASGCGICGKTSIQAIRLRGLKAPNPDFRFDGETLCRLPGVLQRQQAVFSRTGGLHAAALFDAHGKLIVVREDIGRHNAVDKVVGWALLNRCLPLAEHVLLVSGRGGFEIVQKAIAAGLPVLASVSAPSSLAVKLARELGITLAGFLRGRRFVIYSGEFRCLPGDG